MNPKATQVEYCSPFKLLVTFTDGKVKLFDLQPYLAYPIYEPLKNANFCNKAFVNNGIVTWNDEIDVDPDRLYIESVELDVEKV